MIRKKERYNVAVVGATGAVGQEMISVLEQREFPLDALRLFASERSEGKALTFGDSEIPVSKLGKGCFKGIDIALFSAGSEISKAWAPEAVKSGCVVIDNSSCFRMERDVPLVVPEVNPAEIRRHKGIIANPNCSTIQLVTVLKPIHDIATIKRVVITTFQSVSGTGMKAMEELMQQTADILNFKPVRHHVYPHQIAFNCLPHIDAFTENGYTKEELKIVNETKKILADNSIRITATAVRVPVFRCHSESVNIETEKKINTNDVRSLLSAAPGILVYDAPEKNIYPIPSYAAERDEVSVGRIREDDSVENGLNLWIVADNLRKGAALNAVQIAEKLIETA